jgi:DNA-binding NtrC family response regulator
MAGSLKRSLNDLKRFLHDILETPVDFKLNARLGQHLRVDDKVLDRNGPITIIQNQEVKPVVIINISKALRMVDTMEGQLQVSSIKHSQEEILEQLLDDGVTWEQLNHNIKNKYFTLAFKRSGRDVRSAAKMVGVGRSTMSTHLNHMKIKLIEGGQDGSNGSNEKDI